MVFYSECELIKFLLDEEEKKLAIDWLENGDTKAAQKLVTSHLRLL